MLLLQEDVSRKGAKVQRKPVETRQRFAPLRLCVKHLLHRTTCLFDVPAGCHCFTSKRLIDDQLPGVPEAEFARTRNHILVVGSVLVVNCEAVVF